MKLKQKVIIFSSILFIPSHSFCQYSLQKLLSKSDKVLEMSTISDAVTREVVRESYEAVFKKITPEFDVRLNSCNADTDPCYFSDFVDYYKASKKTKGVPDLSTIDRKYFLMPDLKSCGFIVKQCYSAELESLKIPMTESERDQKTRDCYAHTARGGQLPPGSDCKNYVKNWAEQVASRSAANDYLRACATRVESCENIAKEKAKKCLSPGATIISNIDYSNCWTSSRSSNANVIKVKKCELEIRRFLNSPDSSQFSMVDEMGDQSRLKTIVSFREKSMKNSDPNIYLIAKYMYGISDAREKCAQELASFSEETAIQDSRDFFLVEKKLS